MLLTIIDVACGFGVNYRSTRTLFEHLKNLGGGCGVLIRLINLTTDNRLDVTAAVGHLFQLINPEVD